MAGSTDSRSVAAKRVPSRQKRVARSPIARDILHLRPGGAIKILQAVDLRLGQVLERYLDLVAKHQLRLERLKLRESLGQSFDIGPRDMQLHAHVGILAKREI